MSQPLPVQNPFVGRKREQQLYSQMLTGTTPWVMVITGQGGIGKTTLLRHFCELTSRDIPVVSLNFANTVLRTDVLNIVAEISWQLATCCDAQARAIFEQTLAEGRALLSEMSKQTIQTVQIGNDASAEGIQLDMRADLATSREQHRQIQASVCQSLYNQVLTFRPARLVILRDTCEWLSETEGLDVGRMVMDELLPKIHDYLTRHHHLCTAVIASRVPPPLSVIERQNCHTLVLPMLDKASVDTYLEQVGMQDAVLRQRVYAITHGHALCVSIIGVLWQEQGDHPFTLDELPQLQDKFNERALLEFIQDRLDKRLVKPFRELTRFGVLLRSFNLPLLQAVFPELFSGANALDIFQQFTRYPYIESLGNQRRVIHELLREIQAIEIREQQPDEWRTYHKRALDYLTGTAPQSPDWYYHAIAYDEEQGMTDWWDAVQTARNQGKREACNQLLQAAYDVTLNLAPQALAQRAFHLGKYHVNWTDMSAAMDSYEAALGLFRQVGSRLGEANCYQAQGDIALEQDNYQEALTLYNRAYQLFQQIQDGYSQARLLYYRSFIYEKMGNIQQTIQDAELSLKIAHAVHLPESYIERREMRLNELRSRHPHRQPESPVE